VVGIDETFPCLKSIMATTGEAPPPNLKVGEACGKTRFCVHCEAVLSKLAHAWRVPLMADVTIALLRKAVETWADGRDWEQPNVAESAAATSTGPIELLTCMLARKAPFAAQV
jgi:hypothetical protein